MVDRSRTVGVRKVCRAVLLVTALTGGSCALAGFQINASSSSIALSDGGTYHFGYAANKQSWYLRSTGSDTTPFTTTASSTNPAVFNLGAVSTEGSVVVYYAYNNVLFSAVGSTTVTFSRNRKSDGALLEQLTAEVIVDPSPLTITASNASRVYGGASPALGASYAGLAQGESAAIALTTLPTLASAATAVSPVGSYPITATGAASNGNYVLQPPVSGTLTVMPAPLAIRASDVSRVEGMANPVFSAAYTGLVNGETPAVLTTPPVFSTTATAASPPGSYPIIASGATAGNYAIQYVAGIMVVTSAPAVAPVPVPIGNGWTWAMLSLLMGGVLWRAKAIRRS